MKHSRFFAAVALALTIAGLYAINPSLALAAPDSTYGLADLLDRVAPHVSDLFVAAPLVVMRARADLLRRKAEAMVTQITDSMAPDQVRTIETEHEAILRELETLHGEIAAAEEVERVAAAAGAGAGGDNDDDDQNGAVRGGGLTAAQAADIMQIGTRAGMAADVIEQAVRSGVTVDAFRARAFDHLAGQSGSQPTTPARVVRDEAETRRRAMVEAMSYGFGAPVPTAGPSAAARGFMDFVDVPDFAAAAIGHRGRIVTVREREELLTRAFHTTSDFPHIFGAAINTVLEMRYALTAPTYREISRRRDFMDFRPHYAIGIGEFPMLEKLTEAGEIKFGTFGESKEQIAVVPYAKGLRVTRQMLVNDRLGAIADLMGGYGRTVSRFEEITFYAMMLSANTKLSDEQVVFHASHNNLAGSGGAIATATLSAGKAAMRKQKGLDGATLNIVPTILLTSPDKEDEARQYLAPIIAGEAAKVNIHVGTMRPVVSSELTGNAWYLFADPQDAAVYQWGYLDGYTAPRVRLDEPFGTQGIGMTVEHDFGVGAIDYRGGYKNPGA